MVVLSEMRWHIRHSAIFAYVFILYYKIGVGDGWKISELYAIQQPRMVARAHKLLDIG